MYDRMGMDPRMSMGPRMDPRVGPMGMDPRDSLGFDRLSLHRGSQPQQGYAETVRTDQYTRSKEGYPPQTQQDRPRKKYDDLRAMGIIIIGGDDTDNGRA